MTHRLTTNYAKNYCNRTLIVKVIVENVVTCFFWDTVYIRLKKQTIQNTLKPKLPWFSRLMTLGQETMLQSQPRNL